MRKRILATGRGGLEGAKLLALDPGAKTGFAWTTDSLVHVEQAGTWDLSSIRDEQKRFGYLYGEVELFEPTHISYEKPAGLRGKAAVWWHAGYLAVVQLYCQRNGAQLRTIHPMTLKKYATGIARAEKDWMRKAAWKVFGPIPEDMDDNGVDAIWVLAWGLEQFKVRGGIDRAKRGC